MNQLVYEEGEVSEARLAGKLGYFNLTYFRNNILPILLEYTPCIKHDRFRHMLIWTCDESQDPIEQQAREEAEEFFRGVGISG